MSVGNKADDQFPRLYTIHSQKGGVGKTSIAIAIAGFAAIVHKKKALIIDADMTGVSLYDMAGWSDGKEPHYLNEILLASPQRYESILHRNKSGGNNNALHKYFHNIPTWDNIKYLPASPCIDDISCIVPLLSQEDFHQFFQYRLEDIIAATMTAGFDVVIVDNSPGLFGVSKSTLKISLNGNLNHNILRQTAKAHAFIVSSNDETDHLALFPSLSHIMEPLSETENFFSLVMNKITGSNLRKRMDPPLIYKELLDNLSTKKFHDGRNISKDFLEVVKNILRNNGGLAAPYVDGFGVNDILATIKRIQSASAATGHFGKWCIGIGKACGLWPPIKDN